MLKLISILKFLFVISFVTILAELTFLFVFSTKNISIFKDYASTKQSKPSSIELSCPMPTHVPIETVDSILQSWKFTWIKGLTEKSLLTTNFKGILSQINLKGGTIGTNKHAYQIMFELSSLTDISVRQKFYWSAEEVAKLSVFLLVDGVEQKISINDLQTDDIVDFSISSNIYPVLGGGVRAMKIVKQP